MSKEYILRVKCPDKYGLVAKVSTTLNKSNLFILDSAHYGDPDNKYFFMRAKLIYSENLKFIYLLLSICKFDLVY